MLNHAANETGALPFYRRCLPTSHPPSTTFQFQPDPSDSQQYSRRLTLFNEDCLVGMRRLVDACVDVVITSPPYNIGTDYGTYWDRHKEHDYLEWLSRVLDQIYRLLSDDGSLFLNLGALPSDPALPWRYMAAINHSRDRDFDGLSGKGLFRIQNVFHWIKSVALDEEVPPAVGEGSGERRVRTYGHFKPINSPRFVNDCHEYIFHLTKSGNVPLDRLATGVPYEDKSNVKRWSHGEDRRCRGNTWFLPYPTIQSRSKDRPHPATFPDSLPEYCLKLHGLERVRFALDPFMGLGTTARAGARLGVSVYGFELDEGHYTESLARVEALFESEGLAGY